MMRKFLTALALATVGLVSAAGVANAYPDDNVPAVAVDDTLFAPGEVVDFSGVGFFPGETVAITVTYDANALRSSQGIAFAAAKKDTVVVASATGTFSVPLVLTTVGLATITATGQTSGYVLSKQVRVTSDGQAYTGSGVDVGYGAGSGSGAVAAAGSDGGLAYTGASIATPLAIGGGALALGLLMLFFGTRMAIRRQDHSVS